MSPRRSWIKLWCENWLRGSIRKERIEVRAIFADLLTMAGDSSYGDGGKIQIAEDVGFTDEAIAAILNVPLEIWRTVKEILANHKDPEENRIRVRPLKIGYAIEIINWTNYQSEYERQKPSREKLRAKLQPKLHAKCGPKRDTEGEEEGEEDGEEKTIDHSVPLSQLEIDRKFEEFWIAYPRQGRHARKESRIKFGALVKRGNLQEFIKGFHGYLGFLKDRRARENFDQRPMYAKTFLNERWREFVEFKYEAQL